MLGDVNGDAKVTTDDIVLVRHHIDGTTFLTPDQFDDADVDYNSIINDADVRLIRLQRDGLLTLPAMFGDVTRNMVLQSNDTTSIRRIAAGATNFTEGQRELADVDLNGIVTDGLAGTDASYTRDAIGQIRTLPVYLPTELRVTTERLGTTGSAEGGDANVVLMAFEMNADHQDLDIERLSFVAVQGSLSNGARYSLWADLDDNGYVETSIASDVVPVNDRLTFENAGALLHIMTGKHILIEVRAEIITHLPTPATLELGFAREDPLYIQARRSMDGTMLQGIMTNGICQTTCDMLVVSRPSKLWNFTPYYAIHIVQLPGPETEQAAANQRQITLMRFTAQKTVKGDVAMTSIVLTARQGTLDNATNYTLTADTDGDGTQEILQTGVTVRNGRVLFDNMTHAGLPIYETPIEARIIADAAPSVSPSSASLQLGFDILDPEYVRVEYVANGTSLDGIDTDGVCMGRCEIRVDTAPSTIWSFSEIGNLYITQSSTPVRAHQLLGSQISDDMLRVSLRAEGEDINVMKLVFTPHGPDAAEILRSVDRLYLLKEGAQNFFFAADAAQCDTTVSMPALCAKMRNSELIVPKGQSVTIVLRAGMKSDANGATSGKKFGIHINAVGSVEAMGDISQRLLNENNGDMMAEGEIFVGTDVPNPSQSIMSPVHTTALAKIANISNASPLANGTPVPVGSAEIGRFRIDAASQSNSANGINDITLDDIIFTVHLKNVTMNGSQYRVLDGANPLFAVPCTLDPSSTPTIHLVRCSNLSQSVLPHIDSGASELFILNGTVTTASANASLQVTIEQFNDDTQTTVGVSKSHLRWIDADFAAQTSFVWVDTPTSIVYGTRFGN